MKWHWAPTVVTKTAGHDGYALFCGRPRKPRPLRHTRWYMSTHSCFPQRVANHLEQWRRSLWLPSNRRNTSQVSSLQLVYFTCPHLSWWFPRWRVLSALAMQTTSFLIPFMPFWTHFFWKPVHRQYLTSFANYFANSNPWWPCCPWLRPFSQRGCMLHLLSPFPLILSWWNDTNKRQAYVQAGFSLAKTRTVMTDQVIWAFSVSTLSSQFLVADGSWRTGKILQPSID